MADKKQKQSITQELRALDEQALQSKLAELKKELVEQHRAQLADHQPVEGVAQLGPVQPDARHRTIQLQLQALQLHAPAHIRNTPKRVSGMGAFRAAEMPSASTLRVSEGGITPSSHSRADE